MQVLSSTQQLDAFEPRRPMRAVQFRAFGLFLRRIRDEAQQFEGVVGVSKVRGREHGSRVYCDLSITVEPYLSVTAGHQVAEAVRFRILELGIATDVVVHVDVDEEEDLNVASAIAKLPSEAALVESSSMITGGDRDPDLIF